MSFSEKTNRRGFLKSVGGVVAGAAALPYFMPASALGGRGTTAPSDRIAMGFVGVGGGGGIGTAHLRNSLRFSEVQVVAVCDVDVNHKHEAKRIVDEGYGNNNCSMYDDFRELLQRKDLDAVCLSLPDHWHAIPAIEAAKAGLDIYGEKPLSRTIVEGRKMLDAVHRNCVLWQSGTQQRSDSRFHRACELVRNGRIGEIIRVEVGLPDGHSGDVMPVQPIPENLDWDFWLGPAPYVPYRGVSHWDWRWIMDYSGGQYTDWIGHHMDIALWGLGFEIDEPVEVRGWAEYPREGLFNTPVRYMVNYKFSNGVEMKAGNLSDMPKGSGAVWYGTEGWIRVDRGGIWASKDSILDERIGPGDIRLYRSRDHFRNFIDCIKTRQRPIAPIEGLYKTNTIGLVGEIAMLTQRRLLWDPVKETFIDDEQANRYLSRPMRAPWYL